MRSLLVKFPILQIIWVYNLIIIVLIYNFNILLNIDLAEQQFIIAQIIKNLL